MEPIDVLTRHTLGFVLDAIAPKQRVLEVGAGAGHVARALMDAGHAVVAIDASEKAVARARALGVDARLASWPEFSDGPFDAVLFTRSLHHIDRLPEAIDRCWSTVGPQGRVVIEEAAFAAVDAPTAAWFQSTADMLVAAEAVSLPQEGFLAGLVGAADPHAAWHDHHDHMHAVADMRGCLESGGGIVDEREVPYLYRYFCESVPRSDRGAALLESIMRFEVALIEAGAINAVGRRFVCKPCPARFA